MRTRTVMFLSCAAAFSCLWLIVCSGSDAMELTSSAFKDGSKMPTQFAMPGAGGRNLSIPLEWKNAPAGTKSFAVSIIDPHPLAKNWAHWLVINIPANITRIDESASGKNMPQGAVELTNSFGARSYGGPQPPRGSGDHPYIVTIYALNVAALDLPPDADLSAFKNALKGKVLAEATITGHYEQ